MSSSNSLASCAFAFVFCLLSVSLLSPQPASALTSINTSNKNIVPNGLVGYWTFDGKNMTSTTARDLSGNNNTGTLGGTFATSSQGVGKLGQGFSFDGVNDTIALAYNASLNLPDAGGAISVWIKPTGVPVGQDTAQTIFKKLPHSNDNVEGGVSLGLYQYGPSDPTYLRVKLGYDSTLSDLLISTTTRIVNNKWYHVVLTYTNTTIYIYLNGNLEAQMTRTKLITWPNSVGASFGYGKMATSPGVFKGTMDEFRLYNRALSPTEIQTLYKAGGGIVQASTANTKANTNSTGISGGLVGHWTFDGKNMTNATATDSSGGGNNGTLTNMGLSSVKASGKIGQALSFDGVNDMVRIPNESNFHFEYTQPFSTCTWIKPTSLGGERTIMNKMDSGNSDRGWTFGIYGGGDTLHFRMTNNYGAYNFFEVWSSGGLLPNVWQHVCVTYNGNSSATGVKFYRNAVTLSNASIIRDTLSGTILNTSPLSIGNRTYDQYPYIGQIDDARFYSRDLSAKDIQSLYKTGQVATGVSPSASQSPSGTGINSGLVGYWTFDGKNMTNTTAADSSGSGNNGTLTNMTTMSSKTIGKIGQGIKFDGVTSYINGGSNSSLQLALPLSFSYWVKQSSLSSTYGHLSYRETELHNGYFMSSNTDGSLAMSYGDNTGCTSSGRRSKTTSAGVFGPGKWVHIVGVIEGSTNMSIYVNGSNVGGSYTGSGGSLVYSGSSFLRLGGQGGGGGCAATFLNGSLDDVRIYNRALSPTEVKSLYKLGSQ